MPDKYELIVPPEYHLERVDKFLTRALESDLSRSYLQKLIKEGNIVVNQKGIKPNYKIKTDDIITIEIPEPEELKLEPENIPLEFLYQDECLAVINKPAGLVVHPGAGNWNRTLVNALLYHLKDLSSIGGVERPGIVHRLDKDTAGLMVVSKNDRAHRALVEEFARRGVVKRYAAIVTGKPAAEHEIVDRPIGRHPKYGHKMTITEKGREARTEFRLKKIWNTRAGLFSLMEVLLHTGRTHQIRVHLSSLGLPIVGDPVYSKKWEKHRVPHLLLASVYLEFTHPVTGERVRFEIPPPEHMLSFMKKLENIG